MAVIKIWNSEIITYTRKGRRANMLFKELRYCRKWARCSEDQKTLKPLEGVENAREAMDKFYRESPEMPGPNLDE